MDSSVAQKEYDSQDFKGLTLRDAQIIGVEFISCTFTKCSFQETTFKACKFNDCTFKSCDLSLIALQECYFKNTQFEDSQLIGVNWMDTNLANRKAVFGKPVDFIKCALNHSIFMGLNLKRLRLAHCLAVDVSFEEADLTGADCTFTDFKDSRFLHTDLTEADFAGATNYAIAANLNTLKKTKFSLPEAMSLLYSLDILLTEPRSMDNDDESELEHNKMSLPKRSQIRPGMRVQVIEKQNQRTSLLTEGVVRRILTSSPAHPHGIKVMLEDGRVGRVQEIMSG